VCTTINELPKVKTIPTHGFVIFGVLGGDKISAFCSSVAKIRNPLASVIAKILSGLKFSQFEIIFSIDLSDSVMTIISIKEGI
jgi:hypothetical protein